MPADPTTSAALPPIAANCSRCGALDHTTVGHDAARPFCNTWPFPSSDLDLVLPADNAAAHRARGCCDGF